MTNKPNYYAQIPANVRYDKDLSPNAKLFFAEITALSNIEGFCWASNAYFAELYSVTKRSVQLWLNQLDEKGYIKIMQTNEGRRIYIISPHEENFTTPRKKVHGGYEKKFTPPHEENFTHNNTSINTTNNNIVNKNNRSNSNLINYDESKNLHDLNENNNKNEGHPKNGTPSKKPSSAQLENEFAQLWELYPRKIGKKKAFDSFKKARKTKKTPYENIENGLLLYLRHIERNEIEERFIQHGSTWFNQEKWQDEYTTVSPMKKPKNALEYFKRQYGGNNIEPNRNGEIIDNYSTIIPEPFQGF